jgi:16S rRNA (cytosine1402-N4)-methyltransferase
MSHIPVLCKEVLDGLEVSDEEVFVDMTLGNAGHTKAILDSGVHGLTVIGIDVDPEATEKAREILNSYTNDHNIKIHTTYFDSLEDILDKDNIPTFDKILFDLGFRSDQVDNPERGFSFLKEGPLSMALGGPDAKLQADEIVNEWAEESLADIIYGFGEEKFSRRIAKAIIEARAKKRIQTTTELAEIISSSVPAFYRRSKIHPATKTFQAIRIATNSELERIKKVLPVVWERLNPGGRIAVISFHSLEDRIIKNFFKEKKSEGGAKILTKKPIVASEQEILENARSRSAKLRILEKI